MEAIMLQCALSLQPFKPPISKCKGSHMGCGRCVGELLGNPCKKCEQPAMAAVVSRAMVQCPHEGCQSLVTSNKSYDHYIACPHAPCGCTEALHTACGFTSLPRELLVHLAASHSIPVFRFQYGMPTWCMVCAPVLPQGHLFIGYGDEDGSVFGITEGTLGHRVVLCVHQVGHVLVAKVHGAAAGAWSAGAGRDRGLLDGHLDGGNRADEHRDT